MKAAFYERRGPAREVLQVGEQPTPEPGPGEVRVKIAVSAVNPSDTKGRGNWLGATAMAFPLIIPHQDERGSSTRWALASTRCGSASASGSTWRSAAGLSARRPSIAACRPSAP